MAKDKISLLTLKEKALMLLGSACMKTYSIPEKGINGLFLSDGPHGLRCEDIKTNIELGIVGSTPSTCFPTGITLASTWNINLIEKVGEAIGKECVGFGVNILLGPAINIERNPLCGRNFEYYSEDPFLSGSIASNMVKGIQSQRVGSCVKHFACNNNERNRFFGDSVVDSRALHEIYLKPFEMVVKSSKPKAIMTAYNQVNGVFCSENKYLMEDMLRKSWGFDGITMTDWGGIVHRDIALNNGCDLEMPGVDTYGAKLIYDAVTNGTLSEEVVNQSVARLIKVEEETRIDKRIPVDYDAHYQLALSASIEGAVLLKNSNDILPLSKSEKYLVIGGLFDIIRFQGDGSCLVNPKIVKDHKQAFGEYDINYDFVKGYIECELYVNEKLENEALAKAKEYDTILFYGGLNDYVESEGYDKENLSIPNNQLSLLNKLIKLKKKIVVILFNGSPVELPFYDEVDAILDMLLPGEAGGEATTKLLFGEVSPSGKLSESWPMKYIDVPFAKEFTSSIYELYKESIFVGYRYYNTIDKVVRFPFGYGLSYTKFIYSNLRIKEKNNGVLFTFLVKNVGKMNGKEVAQLYIGKVDSKVVRPIYELKGFTKVSLDVNEEKEVSIFVDRDSLAIWVNDEFVVEDGKYEIYVGGSSRDIYLNSSFKISGVNLAPSLYDEIYFKFLKAGDVSKDDFEKLINRKIPEYIPGKKPYTMETPIRDFSTFFGKMFIRSIIKPGLRQIKRANQIEDPLSRARERKGGLFTSKVMINNSLRSYAFSSSGGFLYNKAEAILELANGHLFRGLKKLKKKYKIE